MGWSGMSNGDLLTAVESNFDVVVTLDSNMQYQQHVESLNVAIIVIASRSNRLEDVEPAMTEVNEAVRNVRPGTATRVVV